MKLCHSLVCFLFLQALQDGNADLATAEIPIHAEREGGNITVGCLFSLSGSLRLFCKEKCEQGKILIETTEDTAQRGRYSIEYKEGRFLKTKTVMYVSITKLEVSDSGVYRCSLDRVGVDFFNSNYEFQISVKEASTPTMKMTPQSSNSTVTSSSTEAFQHFPTQPASSDLLLYMGLVVIVLSAFLSAALLIFCKGGATKPKRPPVENIYSSIIDDSQLYEEIREETFPPPVEMSSVYTTATCPQPDGVESSDD